MNNDRLEYLLKQFHADLLNEDEKVELDNWFHSLNYGSEGFSNLLNRTGEEQLKKELLDAFKEKLAKENRKRLTLKTWYAVAASILVLLSIGFLLYNQNQRKAVEQVEEFLVESGDIAPGKDRAVLTLDDGSQIFLDSVGSGQLAKESGIIISKAANGELIYSVAGSTTSNAKISYNHIKTPRGGQYQIVLPDSTKVWLNAASSLRFPVRFDGNERRVELLGEAYFEVSPNKSKPFKVFSEGQEVKVLGTKFNVKAYNDEPYIKTTLLEGSVMVSNLLSNEVKMLSPGQEASIMHKKGSIQLKSVDAEQAIFWKLGYFTFDNERVTSIMKTISRWYDVDVEYHNTHEIERLGGAFSRESNLSEILKNLELVGHMKFKIEGRKIIVSD